MFCAIKIKSTGRAPEERVSDTCCAFGSVRYSSSSWVSPKNRTESALCRLAWLLSETTCYGIRCARTNTSVPPLPVLPDDVSGVSRFPRLSHLPRVNVPQPIWRRGEGYFVLSKIVETAIEFSLNLRLSSKTTFAVISFQERSQKRPSTSRPKSVCKSIV